MILQQIRLGALLALAGLATADPSVNVSLSTQRYSANVKFTGFDDKLYASVAIVGLEHLNEIGTKYYFEKPYDVSTSIRVNSSASREISLVDFDELPKAGSYKLLTETVIFNEKFETKRDVVTSNKFPINDPYLPLITVNFADFDSVTDGEITIELACSEVAGLKEYFKGNLTLVGLTKGYDLEEEAQIDILEKFIGASIVENNLVGFAAAIKINAQFKEKLVSGKYRAVFENGEQERFVSSSSFKVETPVEVDVTAPKEVNPSESINLKLSSNAKANEVTNFIFEGLRSVGRDNTIIEATEKLEFKDQFKSKGFEITIPSKAFKELIPSGRWQAVFTLKSQKVPSIINTDIVLSSVFVAQPVFTVQKINEEANILGSLNLTVKNNVESLANLNNSLITLSSKDYPDYGYNASLNFVSSNISNCFNGVVSVDLSKFSPKNSTTDADIKIIPDEFSVDIDIQANGKAYNPAPASSIIVHPVTDKLVFVQKVNKTAHFEITEQKKLSLENMEVNPVLIRSLDKSFEIYVNEESKDNHITLTVDADKGAFDIYFPEKFLDSGRYTVSFFADDSSKKLRRPVQSNFTVGFFPNGAAVFAAKPLYLSIVSLLVTFYFFI